MANKKFISIGTLALLQIVIVGNLQVLPANAIYGFSLPFLYLLAVLLFYLPCVVMVTKLASQFPQTGGAFLWCEHAFDAKKGFFVITLLWVSNLFWYPSLFALIATNLAYLMNPLWGQNKLFVIGFSILSFWVITWINCIGIKPSLRFSAWCSIIGIILPIVIIIFCGIMWVLSGNSLAISLQQTPLFPDLLHFNNVNYLIVVVISLFGAEVAAVHAREVENPKRDFPISIFISSVMLIILLLGAELSIAVIIPSDKLSVVTGLLDALQMFFQVAHIHPMVYLLLLVLIFIGNLGSVAAWMLGSTRGMFVAVQNNHIIAFFQKTNKQGSPIGVLVFEAILFTIASFTFLLFPKIIDGFWLLLVLASQITLIYYACLFISAIKLGVNLPLMVVGLLTSMFAFGIGFIPPADLDGHQQMFYWAVLGVGLVISCSLPIGLLRFSRQQK